MSGHSARPDPPSDKQVLRSEMRTMRRTIADRTERSSVIWQRLQARSEVLAAGTIMAFDSIPGEPETAEFVLWCRERGITVVMPEEDPDPTSLDVVVVPGVAFTTAGERLGQGGGWYDRYLPRLRSTCLTVGVGFAEQVVDSLPTEAHDVMLDSVITDAPGDGGA